MDDATNKGMDPDVLAEKILRDIMRGKQEVYYGGKEVLGVYLKRFFPGYFSKVIGKMKVV
jgi:hypothetical protein